MAERPFASVKTFLLILVCLAVWLTVAFFGFGCGPVRPDTQPKPPVDQTAAKALCDRIWREELRRPIDVGSIGPCVSQLQTGVLEATIRAQVKASPEWAEVHKPKPPETTRPTVVKGRIGAKGERFVYAATGQPFVWRGATAFRLVELVANGHEADARAFLKWARDTKPRGFTVVRVLVMCWRPADGGMFLLEPAKGRAALPRLLDLAKEYDLYVEVVALAATRRFNFTEADGRAHLRAVAQIVAQHENAVLQIANEYMDGSQADFVQNVTRLTALASEIPAVVFYTVSSPNGEFDERDQPQGEYLTRHRSRARDKWNNARRIVEIARVGSRAKKPIVDDEPTGADEKERGGSRTTDPAVFCWQGLAATGHGIGSTFHFENGLQAKVPGPKQQAGAEAFLACSQLVPETVDYHFENAQHSTSPVKGANFDRESDHHKGTIVRAFSFVAGAQSFTAALGVTGDPKIQWQNGYTPRVPLKDYPQLKVWRIAK